MSDYCRHCHYDYKLGVGDKACPFNALYWRFFLVHQDRLKTNNRLSLVYKLLEKKTPEEKQQLIAQAESYLERLNDL
jgi:deoxyribodipyrimidine photolyase-related protein